MRNASRSLKKRKFKSKKSRRKSKKRKEGREKKRKAKEEEKGKSKKQKKNITKDIFDDYLCPVCEVSYYYDEKMRNGKDWIECSCGTWAHVECMSNKMENDDATFCPACVVEDD